MSNQRETERRAPQVPVRRLDRPHPKEYCHTGRLRLGMYRKGLLYPNR